MKSSHRRCSVKKGVLRNFTKFTGKHLHQSLFFNKVADLRLKTRTDFRYSKLSKKGAGSNPARGLLELRDDGKISDNGPDWDKAKRLSLVSHTTKTIHHHHHQHQHHHHHHHHHQFEKDSQFAANIYLFKVIIETLEKGVKHVQS